jgi:hypothetical protein
LTGINAVDLVSALQAGDFTVLGIGVAIIVGVIEGRATGRVYL